MLREYATSIILKLRCSVNAAGHWTTSKHLGFDLIGTTDNTVLLDSPSGVVCLGPAVAGLSGFGRVGRGAVHAFLHGRAGEFLGVVGLVGLAGLFGDAVLVGKDEHLQRVATITATASEAVDKDLWREGHVWPGSSSCNVDSISNRAGRTMCPASSAVFRHVLIPAPRYIVHSGNITPVPVGWEVLDIQVFVRTR
jgi:hypothetical protein